MVTISLPVEQTVEKQTLRQQALERLHADAPQLRECVVQALKENIAEMIGPFSSMRQIPTFAEQLVGQFLDVLDKRLTAQQIEIQLRYWVQRGLGPEGAFAIVDMLYNAAKERDSAQVLTSALDDYRHQFSVAYETGRRKEILAEQERMQRGLYAALEKQIASERETRLALERRQNQLQIAAELASVTSVTRDLNELLSGVVRQLQEHLGLEFCGIFLLDNFHQWAILRAGAGSTGVNSLKQGYQLALEQHSPIGRALTMNQPLILHDGKYQQQYFAQPLQPSTPLTVVLPLSARSVQLGVLTLHSGDMSTFNENDLPLLQVMADNVAYAIENAQLFVRSQASLEEMERAQRGYVRETWDSSGLKQEILYSQSQDTFQAVTEPTPPLPSNGAGSQTALTVPITLRGQVIGTVDVFDASETRSWSEDDKALASSVVEQLALAVDNARLFEQSQQRAEELAAINEITNIISQQLELDRLLAEVHTQVQRVLVTDAFFVSLYDAATGMVSYPFVYDDGRRYESPITPLPPRGFLRQVVTTGKSILLNRTPEEIAQTQALMNAETALGDVSKVSASLLYTPLRTGDVIIGIISAQTYTPNAYKQRDLELIEGIGIHVAVALQNARLFETTQQRAQETTIINEMARELSGELDQEKLFDKVYAYLPRLMPTDVFAVWFFDEESNTVTRPVLYDLEIRYPPQLTPVPPSERLKSIIEPNSPLVIHLSREEWEAARQNGAETFGSNEAPASMLYVPLRVGARLLGVMSVHSYQFNVYGEAEVALLTSVANYVASGLESTRLFAETQEALAETRLLYRIGGQLNQLTSLEDLVRIAAQPAFDRGAGSSQLLLLDYQGQNAPRAADVAVSLLAPGEPAPFTQYTHFPIEQFTLGKALLARPTELVTVADVNTSEILDQATRAVLLSSRTQAVALMPLSVEQHVLGVIVIGWEKPHPFDEQERRIYQALAGQMALVLNNRILFEQTQEALAEAQTLYEISARLNASNTIQEVLEAAAGPAIVQGAFSASLLRVLLDEQGTPNELAFAALWPRNVETPVPIGTRFSSEFISDTSWIENPSEPLLIPDMTADARVNEFARAAYLSNTILASALLPLKLGDRWIGALNFNWQEPHHFTPRDVRVFRSVMAQAATVLDNRALFEQTQKALAQTQTALLQVQQAQERLNLQYQTANILARATSFEQAATHLLENTCRSLDWQMGEYWAIDETRNILALTHIWSVEDDALKEFAAESAGLVFARGEGLSGRTWAEGQPIWVPNIQLDPLFKQVTKGAQAGLVSALAFPLQSEARQFGVTVFFTTYPAELDEALLTTMVGVGSQIGQFLERRRAEEAVRQQNTYLTALHDTTLGLMRRLDVKELMQNIITRAGELVGTEHGYVHLIEPSGSELRMHVGIGIYQDFVGTRVKPGQGLAGTVWRNQEPIVVDDYRQWSGRLPMVDRDVLRAVVGVPLKSGEQTVGVLGLASLQDGRTFTGAQVEALNRFAELATVALDNAQLYNASQEALQQTQRLAQREKASAQIADKLYAAPDVKTVLQTAAEELRRSTGSRRAVVRLNLGSNTQVEKFHEGNGGS